MGLNCAQGVDEKHRVNFNWLVDLRQLLLEWPQIRELAKKKVYLYNSARLLLGVGLVETLNTGNWGYISDVPSLHENGNRRNMALGNVPW